MDDLISRRAAIEAIEQLNIPEDMCVFEILSHIQLAIGTLPSAQPEKMQLSTEKTQLSEEDATKDATFDCISREDAIDAVKQHMNNVSGGNDEYYIAHRHIIELLHIVPTAEPESRREWYMKGYRDAQRWIPVTERLPKNGHYYLKCTKYGNVDVDYYWDGFEEATKYGEEIVAWMEKPKPYNGGGQNDE